MAKYKSTHTGQQIDTAIESVANKADTTYVDTALAGKADTATTLSGYGITDAKISSGVITLGSNTITPITSHQDISGKADKSYITAGTAGTSSSTSGSTLSVPYLTMNSSGIVTGYGTHTHTVTGFSTTDTKNTAGTTNTTSKIYLAGATSQGDNPQTYSNSSCYASGGYLYSGGTKVSVEGHTHTYLPLSGGTLTGVTVAQNNTSYTTKQVRNIFISTSSPSGGSNGDIWIKYTA